MFIELIECTEYLHNQDIVHGLLNPSNIFIRYNNNGRYIKVCEFGLPLDLYLGINKSKSESGYHSDDPETLLELRSYIATELINNYKKYSESKDVDVYSLGMIALKLFGIDYNE